MNFQVRSIFLVTRQDISTVIWAIAERAIWNLMSVLNMGLVFTTLTVAEMNISGICNVPAAFAFSIKHLASAGIAGSILIAGRATPPQTWPCC